MKLFNKDNDLIKRIMNLILVIWIIAGIVISYRSAVDLMFDYEAYTYEEYQTKYCIEEEDQICKQRFESDQNNRDREKRDQMKVLINSVGNVIIVGAFIFFLNRDKK